MNKLPTILIVHNYYQIPGGEDTVVENEKKLLEANGHKVILYTRNNSELKTFNKLQKILLGFTTIFSIKTYIEVRRIIKQQKIDIVHTHNTWNLVSPSVYFSAFSCKVPVVQTIHNFRLLCPGATLYRDGEICEDCINKGLRCAVKHKCYRRSLLQTLACVSMLLFHRSIGTYKRLNYICLTEFNLQKLLELNRNGKKTINGKKIFAKPNIVNVDVKIIPYVDRKNQFVFIGRLDKLKGIDLLLEAWKGIEDFELIICGIGPEENYCREFIDKNHLTNVKMIGLIPNAKAIEIISESKALILPTQWYEGFPITIVESYASGTPVIGSDIGNVGNLIKENITGLKFMHNSVDDLKISVLSLGDMVETTRDYYDFYYKPEDNYRKLMNIYKTILNHS